MGDGRLIAFQRPVFGLLITPAQLRQDAADLSRVVADLKLALDDGGDPPRGPEIVGIAVTLGAQGARSLGRRWRCRGVNLAGRPGVGLALSPGSPLRRQISRHCHTALTAAPTIRATVDSEWPPCTSRTALRRRRSNSAALPTGLMNPA